MKLYQDKVIVAVDTGYGNIKTANHCFRTGITAYDSEPLFTRDMLVYAGKYYLIGEGHKEFLPEKFKDSNVDINKIMWEAPHKPQQAMFIKMLGANVNLGNIATNEVIALEALRMGFRGDTFFQFLPDNLKQK